MGSQYSTETKAEVIEMARQGKTSLEIASETDVPTRTANDWIKAARDLAIAENRDPMLVDGEYRLAFLGQRIQESQLEELVTMAEAGESTLKYGLLTNAIKGTSIDKIQNNRGPGGDTYNILALINQHAERLKDDVIEGDVVDGD